MKNIIENHNIMLSNKILRVKLFTILVTLYPILNVYRISIGNMPLGDLLALFLIPYFIFGNMGLNIKVYKSGKWYYYFVIYSVVMLPVMLLTQNTINVSDIISKTFHLLLYFVYALIFAAKYFDFSYAQTLVIKWSSVLSVLAIGEQFVYNIFHKQLYLILPFMKLNYTIEDYDTYVSKFDSAVQSQGYRSSALFLEPAHMSMYIILAVLLLLFSQKKKNNNLMLVVLQIAGILCSYSASGLLCILFCLVYYLFFYKEAKSKILYKIIFIVICILGVLYLYFRESRIFLSVFERINSIGNMTYDTTGNRRVLRGFFVWLEVPSINKIFGTGVGCFLQTIIDNDISVLTDVIYSEEVNQFFYVLSTFGFVGAFIYFKAMIDGIRNGIIVQRMVGIIILIMCSYNNMLFQAISVIYLCILFSKNSTSVMYN